MSKLLISTGTSPNDGNGDSLLTGANKINSNFNEIYNSIGNGSNINIGVGKTIISTNSLGNVGIGTTYAQEKLHVNGNLLVNESIDISNIRLLSGIITSTSGIITYYGDASKLSNLPWELSSSGIHTTKNVGIGTTNPISSLHIVGSQFVTGVITSVNFNATNGSITNLTGTAGTITTFNSTNGTITNLTGTNLNYTGIGTIATLISTNSNITTGNITTGNITTGIVTTLRGTNLNYTGIGTVGSLSIGSTQVISSGRQLQNITSLDETTKSTIENAIQIAPNNFNDLQITGISTFTNGPVLVGSASSTGTVSQILQVTGGIYASSNIGIGTTNPSALLHIGPGGTTTGSAPLEFTSGSLLTVPESGVVEYDGTTIFATPNTNFGRASIPTTIYTSGQGTSLTTATESTTQPLFPSTNDTITLPVGTYYLKFNIFLTRAATSTTSASLNITLNGSGGGSVGTFSGMAFGSVATTTLSSITVSSASISSSTPITVATTTASAVYQVSFSGILRITTSGTFQPRYSLSANLASATGLNTLSAANFMMIQSISSSSTSTFTGAWS